MNLIKELQEQGICVESIDFTNHILNNLDLATIVKHDKIKTIVIDFKSEYLTAKLACRYTVIKREGLVIDCYHGKFNHNFTKYHKTEVISSDVEIDYRALGDKIKEIFNKLNNE